MQSIYIGVDPGLTGAVVALTASGDILAVYDTPTVEVVKGGRRRHEPDVPGMADIMRKVAELGDVRLVCLEKVQPMPMTRRKGPAADAAGKEEGWGATPNFSLGMGAGLWWMAVVFARMPLERVAPMTWRSALLKGLPAGKESGRLRALELFPHAADFFKRKKDHGRADAALLAEYGRRQRP